MPIVFPAFLHEEGIGGHPATDARTLASWRGNDHVCSLLLDERLYGIQGGACMRGGGEGGEVRGGGGEEEGVVVGGGEEMKERV